MSDHDYNAYTHGCRCEVCRRAKAEYQRRRRQLAKEIAAAKTQTRPGGWPPGTSLIRHVAPGLKHGSAASYQEGGCRCLDCTRAYSAKSSAEKTRRAERRRSA